VARECIQGAGESHLDLVADEPNNLVFVFLLTRCLELDELPHKKHSITVFFWCLFQAKVANNSEQAAAVQYSKSTGSTATGHRLQLCPSSTRPLWWQTTHHHLIKSDSELAEEMASCLQHQTLANTATSPLGNSSSAEAAALTFSCNKKNCLLPAPSASFL
jgi:hypothetical protein